MTIISIILLILRLIFKLPSMISTLTAIIKLLPKFKEGDFWDDLALIGEIIGLIIGLVKNDRLGAKEAVTELYEKLKHPTLGGSPIGLEELKIKIKSKCEGVACPADLV